MAEDHPDTDYDAMTDNQYEDFIRSYLWPSTLEKAFVGIFIVVFIVGVIGNALVVLVVITKRRMWSSMNIVLANLACADLLVLIFCLPPTVINDVTKTFFFSTIACKCIIFFQNTSVYVAIQSLMFISFERWRAITYPLKRPFKATRIAIISIWIISILLSMPEPITVTLQHTGFRRPNFSSVWGTRCSESWSRDFEQRYQVFIITISYVIPLLVISCLGYHMRQTLNNSELKMGKRQLAHRRKAIRMLAAVVTVFAFSYLPAHWHNLEGAFTNDVESVEEAEVEIDMNWVAFRKFFPRFCSYSSSCLNPIVYNFLCSRFRKEFARLICRRSMRREARSTLRYTAKRLQRQNNGIFSGSGISSFTHGTIVRQTLSSSMDSLTTVKS